ncbi:50S ribosomal protein L29 [Candidatus Pacearchaeota archaeon]|nr:50S ribosomal protein L29 [Candidatus Pacearchaeota archaeon]
MAILKKQDIKKMNEKERNEKIKELQMELIKERVALQKGGKIKVKEIKRTIARLLTYNTLNRIKSSVENK